MNPGPGGFAENGRATPGGGDGHRSTYVRVSCGSLTAPSGEPEEDGARLAANCLATLDDPARFPPRLFILWLTPSFLSGLERFLGALYAALHCGLQKFDSPSVPLIGASVGGCIFSPHPQGELEIHKEGAVLVCLASRLLKARVAVGLEAQSNPSGAAARLLQDLRLGPGQAISPRRNRFLVTFLPGYDETGDPANYRAAEVVEALSRDTYGALPMFGGVASAGLERGAGVQLVGDKVYQGAAVAALITTDLSYGLGLSQGLRGTNQSYHVRDVAEDGRRIVACWEKNGDPIEILKSLYPPWVFGQEIQPGEHNVIVPRIVEGRVTVQRKVTTDATLRVMQPSFPRMLRHLNVLKKWMEDNFHIPKELIIGGLGISCISRYRERNAIGWDYDVALNLLRQRYPTAAYIGCFMDGEVGIDHLGRTLFSNWGVTELFFADDIPGSAHLYRVSKILTKPHPCQTSGDDQPVKQAMQQVLDWVERAGYVGGMVSLLLRDRDTEWIIAHEARGGRWREVVLPLTRRPLHGNDILAQVVREKKAAYVPDARTDPRCNRETARQGEVVSFYALPLLDEHGQAIGVLQIDLGDLRHLDQLDADRAAALDTLGRMATDAIARATQSEQLELSQRLDEVQEELSQRKSLTVADAAARFITEAAQVMKVGAHVRLAVPGTTKLRLVGGIGSYYKAAWVKRFEIDTTEPSPSTTAFTGPTDLICNDALQDSFFQELNDRLHGTAVGDAHAEIAACAIYRIGQPGEEPIGLFSVHSRIPWFFTQSRLDSLRTLGKRLALLLAHVKQKYTEERKLTFLREIKPSLEPESEIHPSVAGQARKSMHVWEALQVQAKSAREAAGADVLSFYLWDEERKRFVLRAQDGWQRPEWVHAAWLKKRDVLGRAPGTAGEPQYLENVFSPAWKGSGYHKYLQEMFGGPMEEGYTCEVISLPLHFNQQSLGITIMYRKRQLQSWGTTSAFATTDPSILREASKNLSAAVFALLERDFTRWHDCEMTRLNVIGKTLLRHEDKPVPALLKAFCREVIRQYKLRICSVYLADKEGRKLHLFGKASRPAAQRLSQETALPSDAQEIDEDIRSGNSPIWKAFKTQHTQEERARGAAQENPLEVRKERRAERMCIPFAEANVRGVLDLQWHGERKVTPSGILPRHSRRDLEELATRLAEALKIQRLQEEALWTAGALEGTAAYLLQKHHDLLGCVQRIKTQIEAAATMVDSPNGRAILATLSNDVCQLVKILDVARETYSAGEPEEHVLNDLLTEVLRQRFQPMADEGHITLKSTLPTFPIRAKVFPGLTSEIFANPIDNAIRALMKHSKPEPLPCIHVSLRSVQGGALIEIRDNGPGILREKLDQIHTGKKVRSDQGSGTGLLITRRFCERHRGRLEIESSPGAGTVVRAFIPFEEIK